MKILVVEDEAKIAGSLQRGLQAEGYVVDVAADGDMAETLAGAGSYDLVLLDWMIPGKYDGPGLIRLWHDQKQFMPILMLTARGTIGDRVTGLDTGADDYLPKPFSFDELLARVRALLRRPAAGEGTVHIIGDVTLNSVSKTVTKAGKPIHLTAKEFQLLEYLALRRGEVLSKDQLLDHVWADDSRVQHNTVETFVANLRKKVDKPGGENIVKTVRGFGYTVAQE
ncbi:MAG TPA: response regulator transcription factor [Candidatus Saccharimonadales bacterium]|nr:response regulator transcription factor [Candidatus Saccharimonadales bacterium]